MSVEVNVHDVRQVVQVVRLNTFVYSDITCVSI